MSGYEKVVKVLDYPSAVDVGVVCYRFWHIYSRDWVQSCHPFTIHAHTIFESLMVLEGQGEAEADYVHQPLYLEKILGFRF